MRPPVYALLGLTALIGCQADIVEIEAERPSVDLGPPRVATVLVMGQSNAAAPVGAAHGEKPPFPRTTVDDRVLAWDGGAWVSANPWVVAGDGAGVGQWLGAFGERVVDQGDAAALRCVAQTQGGSSVERFLPKSLNYKAMLAKLETSGAEPRHFFWWQGEANYTWDAATHLDKLLELRRGLMSDVPSLEHIVAFQIAEAACEQDMTEVRMALSAWAERDDVTLVNLDDLTGDPTYHDGCHYTRLGYREAAARLHAVLFP